MHIPMVRVDGHYLCSCGFEPPQEAPGTNEARVAVERHALSFDAEITLMKKLELTVGLNDDGTTRIHMNVAAEDIPMFFTDPLAGVVLEAAQELIVSDRAQRN